MKDDECIVLLDFAENYSYAVQHAVHAVLLLAFIKSKNISITSVTACYQCTYLHHNANVVHILVYHMLQSHEDPFQYKKIQKFNKSNSPSRWPSILAFFCQKYKCLVTQSSFQNNHILNVDLIYDLCVKNVPGVIFIKINTDEMSQNFLCKKDIYLLIVFKAQEFAIILLLQLMALKWESFLLIRVHQMSPFQKFMLILILLTLC